MTTVVTIKWNETGTTITVVQNGMGMTQIVQNGMATTVAIGQLAPSVVQQSAHGQKQNHSATLNVTPLQESAAYDSSRSELVASVVFKHY